MIRLTRIGCFSAAGVLALITVLAETLFAQAPADPQAITFFEKKVRPLLAEHCWKCHGPEKQRGGLRLDSREALLAGGDSGPVVVAGDPDNSLLISAVKYESLEMPPTGKLPSEAIDVLTAWVRMNLPWPDVDRGGPAVRPRGLQVTQEDRQHWAYQPVVRAPSPTVPQSWGSTPIDAFVWQRLLEAGLSPAPQASKQELVRRAYFDLWGIPPTWEEVAQLVEDPRPDAFSRLVDRLLEHPNYGRHWARHWLDLVRYAESDGYKQDAYRPNAYRYRDYVIDSLNEDKPYNQFVLEQLAGDEIAPNDPRVLVATGFLRHTIYEYNQRDVRTQWDWMITEVTDVTAEVFLATSLGCARCHDHKFDPIPQQDYYRFRAFFEAMVLRDDIPAVPEDEFASYLVRRSQYDAQAGPIRAAIAEMEAPFRERVAEAAIDKFPKDVRPMLRKSAGERTPYEEQIARLAGRQIELEQQNFKMDSKLKGEDKERYETLCRQLAALDAIKPPDLPTVMSVSDVGPQAPPTYVGGSGKAGQGESVEPGTLQVLPLPAPAVVPVSARSTGRRLALAQWITDPANPLTARVIVNRVWQYHFGRGLVATSSDFGRLGDRPSHPELLDWLASEFVDRGWRLKDLHRLIMNSAVYQQSSQHPEAARCAKIDPQNRLLWRWPVRRLTAEQIRDAMLAVSGQLRERGAGPASEVSEPVRSIYTKVVRNARDPLLEVFDGPDGFTSVSQRHVTTTAPQALLMMNSPSVVGHAEALARLAVEEAPEDASARVAWLYRRLYCRPPTEEERVAAVEFVERQAAHAGAASAAASVAVSAGQRQMDGWVDLCHVLLNTSEFFYVP